MPAHRTANPIRRLLVATDFTPGAGQAIRRAALLPLARAARITLVHVLPPLGTPLRAREQAEARKRLEFEATGLRRALRRRDRRDVAVATRTATGDPFAGIVALGQRAELILLGRHGARRFRDLLLGTTAERVIRWGHRPVLVVGTTPRRPYRRALVGVDLSEPSRHAIVVAARLIRPDERALTVAHVYEAAHESMLRRVARPADVAAYVGRCRVDAEAAVASLLRRARAAAGEVVLRRGDPRATILRLAKERGADLLALGSHGRAALAGNLVGTMEAIVRHAPCDVLVVPEP